MPTGPADRARARRSRSVRHLFLEEDLDGPGLLRRSVDATGSAAAVVRAALVARAATRALARPGHRAVQSRAAAEAARSRAAARIGPPRRARRPRGCRDSSITSDSHRFASASSTSTGDDVFVARRSCRAVGAATAPSSMPKARRPLPATRSVERARAFLQRVDPAVAGQQGDLRTFRVCCRIVRGFDLSDDEAVRALTEWNARCEPPWSERELRQKVTNARTVRPRAVRAVSCETPSCVCSYLNRCKKWQISY